MMTICLTVRVSFTHFSNISEMMHRNTFIFSCVDDFDDDEDYDGK